MSIESYAQNYVVRTFSNLSRPQNYASEPHPGDVIQRSNAKYTYKTLHNFSNGKGEVETSWTYGLVVWVVKKYVAVDRHIPLMNTEISVGILWSDGKE